MAVDDSSISNAKSARNSIQRIAGYGDIETSGQNILRGINTRNVGNLAPANQDNQGFTFFTKPMLNLSKDNIGEMRKLLYLASPDAFSMGIAIKEMLTDRKMNLRYDPSNVVSKIVDPEQAFISVLSNTLVDLTGWPDHLAEFFTSEEGIAKETYGWVDSRPEYYGDFTLNANFVNTQDDPVTQTLSAWYHYQGYVAYGSMDPWPYFKASNALDYQTRIYRIILDKTKQKVVKIGCTGISMLEAVPDGASFNYTNESVYSADSAQISIPFKSYGVRYNDPIVISDFNRTVVGACAGMSDKNRARVMVKLTPVEQLLMCYKSFPRISEDFDMEWYARITDYNSEIGNLT